VLGKTIPRILGIQVHHLAVPRHLGQDRGRTDCSHCLIAFDNCLDGAIKDGTLIAIDQHQFRRNGQCLNRTPHGEKTGLQDIQAIDLLDFGPGYRVYFGRDGESIVILLGGSTKQRQRQAIEAAKERWADYRRRKDKR